MSKRRAPTTYGSAVFKSRCLELIDRVKQSRTEIIVTRHGRPVARLVPFETAAPTSLIGAMAGSVVTYDRPFDPAPASWSIDARGDEP